MMHGCLNILVADVFAREHALDEAIIQEIVAEEQVEVFTFDDQHLSWRSYRADLVQIARQRRSGIVSIGSCSFTEPRDDLIQLQLWSEGTPHA